MSDYSTLKGFNIQSLATDPYVSTVAAGTWASGGARNNGYYDGTGCGTQTAALAVFGAAPALSLKTEEYNGTAWTEVTGAPTAFMLSAGGGIQTTAVFASGAFPGLNTESYEYDGTNWTEGGDINSGRKGGWRIWNFEYSSFDIWWRTTRTRRDSPYRKI